jgi:hypothetical protein
MSPPTIYAPIVREVRLRAGEIAEEKAEGKKAGSDPIAAKI